MFYLRFIFATALASLAGFSIHYYYGRGYAADYVGSAAQAGRLAGVLQEPYPNWLVLTAAATALLPTFGKVVAFLLLEKRLPGATGLSKGLCFGGLLLLMNDTMIRQPLMNFLVGSPADIVLVQSVEGWLIGPIMGIIIGVTMASASRRKSPPYHWSVGQT